MQNKILLSGFDPFGGEPVNPDAPVLAAAAGLSVPDATELIAVKVVKCGAEDILNDEIMGPVLKLKSYQTFEEVVDMAVGYLMNSGIGHTAGIFS